MKEREGGVMERGAQGQKNSPIISFLVALGRVDGKDALELAGIAPLTAVAVGYRQTLELSPLALIAACTTSAKKPATH